MCSNSIPKTGTPDVPDSFSLGRSDLWAESSLDREFNTPRFSTFDRDHIVSAFEMFHTVHILDSALCGESTNQSRVSLIVQS